MTTTTIRQTAVRGRAAIDQLAQMAVAAQRAVAAGERPWEPRSRAAQAAYDDLVVAAGAEDPELAATLVAAHAACATAWHRQGAARSVGLSAAALADATVARIPRGARRHAVEGAIITWISGTRHASAWHTAWVRTDQQTARAIADVSGLGEAGVRAACAVAGGGGTVADAAWVTARAARAGMAAGSPAADARALLAAGRPAPMTDTTPALAADPAELVERRRTAAAAASAVERLAELADTTPELRRAWRAAMRALDRGRPPSAATIAVLRAGLGALPEAAAIAADPRVAA